MIVELSNREWRHRPHRNAETHEQTARLQTSERPRKCGFPDTVVDDIAELVTADLFDTCDEILLVIEDDVIAAVGERKVGLCLGAHGTNDMRSHRPRPLAR